MLGVADNEIAARKTSCGEQTRQALSVSGAAVFAVNVRQSQQLCRHMTGYQWAGKMRADDLRSRASSVRRDCRYQAVRGDGVFVPDGDAVLRELRLQG